MARDLFGNKKITKEDMYTKIKVTNADVMWEYVKFVIWLALGYAYFHFIIAGLMWQKFE